MNYLNRYRTELEENGFVKSDLVVEESIVDKIVGTIQERCESKKSLKMMNQHFAVLSQPFLIEECLNLALSEKILQIPRSYFQDRDFYLGTCNLRRSFCTPDHETTTTLYHRDRNLGDFKRTHKNFLKVFVYLCDVGNDNGPFTYIKGSNNIIFEDLNSTYRLDDRFVESALPNRKVEIVGKKGSIISALTTGVHKGKKVQSGFRDLFTINFASTFEPNSQLLNIDKKLYNEMNDEQKRICKFLKKVEI